MTEEEQLAMALQMSMQAGLEEDTMDVEVSTSQSDCSAIRTVISMYCVCPMLCSEVKIVRKSL